MIDVKKIAKLANLPIPEKQRADFEKKLNSILDLISRLKEIKTENVIPTAQVTGQENALREDEIDTSRMLTQDEALTNAKNKKGGFFCVTRQINY